MAYTDVGTSIRDARKRAGLNQEQLAELARLNRVTIAKYEAGKVEPGAQALSRIADALEVSVDELLGREPSTDPQPPAQTQTFRIISSGLSELPPEEQEKILAILRAMYSNNPDLFSAKRGNDDET